ncbi:MAG: MFS transporter, partial [Chloroflexi bacterium]|nr:MFS transporter [Chloroflexota bacterium]
SKAAPAHPHAQTIGYYLSFVALGLVVASLGPTLPALASNTHSPLREVSVLFSARAFGYLCGSVVGGRLYDRIAGHRVMALVTIAIAILLAFAPLVSTLVVLTMLMFVLGINEGTLDVGGNSLIVWVHGHKVGPYMNALHFFFGVGAFLSPLVVALALVWSGDIQWAYWIIALLVAPVALWLWRVPSPSVQRASGDHGGEVNRLLVVLIMLFFFVYAGAEGGFGGWVFTYAVGLHLADEPTAAYLTSTFWGALTLGRLLSIPLAARFSPRSILLVDLLGCLLSVIIVLLSAQSLALTWLGTFALGLCMASIFPTTLTFAERRMTVTGQVTGWFFVGSSLGAMFWPWLIGQLFEVNGPLVVMLTVVGDLAMALALLLALNAHAQRSAVKPLESAQA